MKMYLIIIKSLSKVPKYFFVFYHGMYIQVWPLVLPVILCEGVSTLPH